MLRAWRSMSAEERNTIVAKWRERFKEPAEKTAARQWKKTWTPQAVHHLADRLGVRWDNDPTFMRDCEKWVGKAHLDQMTPQELHRVAERLMEPHSMLDKHLTADQIAEVTRGDPELRELCEMELKDLVLIGRDKPAVIHKMFGLAPPPVRHLQQAEGGVKVASRGRIIAELLRRAGADNAARHVETAGHNFAVGARKVLLHEPRFTPSFLKGKNILPKKAVHALVDTIADNPEALLVEAVPGPFTLPYLKANQLAERALGIPKLAGLSGSKEQREAQHRADQHFRSDSPKKWDAFIDKVKRKSFVAAVANDVRADAKLQRHTDQMNRLLTGKKVDTVRGDTGEYDIVKLRGGGHGCTCADWRYKKSVAPAGEQDCKHLAAWKAKKPGEKIAGDAAHLLTPAHQLAVEHHVGTFNIDAAKKSKSFRARRSEDFRHIEIYTPETRGIFGLGKLREDVLKRYEVRPGTEGRAVDLHYIDPGHSGDYAPIKTASVLGTLAAHPKSLFAGGTALGVGALALGLHRNSKSTQFTPAQKQVRSAAMHEVAGLGLLASPYVARLAEAGAASLGQRPGRVGMAARAAHSVLEPLTHALHGTNIEHANELLGLGILAKPAIQEMHHLQKHGTATKEARVRINIPHVPERIAERVPGLTLQQAHATSTKIRGILEPLGGHNTDLPPGNWHMKIPGHGKLVLDRTQPDAPGILRTFLDPEMVPREGSKNLTQAFAKADVEKASVQIKGILDAAKPVSRPR